MKLPRIPQLSSELFVVTTSLAALAHSTWTLCTLFSGPEPHPQFDGAWFAWVIPGFLIAISFDVGMLSISHEIRNGGASWSRYIALLVLSLSMFLLQWGYIVHHMPALALGPGVREDWRFNAAALRDSLLWVVPALLPIAVTLHTFRTPNKVIVAPTQQLTVPQVAEVPVTIEQPTVMEVPTQIEPPYISEVMLQIESAKVEEPTNPFLAANLSRNGANH